MQTKSDLFKNMFLCGKRKHVEFADVPEHSETSKKYQKRRQFVGIKQKKTNNKKKFYAAKKYYFNLIKI